MGGFFILIFIMGIVFFSIYALNKQEEVRRENIKKEQKTNSNYIRHVNEKSVKTFDSEPVINVKKPINTEEEIIIKTNAIADQVDVSTKEAIEDDVIKKYDQDLSAETPKYYGGIKILESQHYTKMVTYLLEDLSLPREINSFYHNIGTTSFSLNDKQEVYTKLINTDRFAGRVNVLLEKKIIALDLKITNTADAAFSGMYFTPNDLIKVSMVIDLNYNVIDFSINKVKNESLSFKEVGNYLYNYPKLTINRFGISQFSYLQATKVCEILINTLKNSFGELELLFN